MIYDTNDIFDFKKNVTFISPKSVSNGCYFIRCFGMNQTPLYIQSPKCKSKQGIVKTGKKIHCDLLFTHEDESFLRWIEDFENQCQQILFENRNKWFDSDLEMHDIENSFASSFKIHKSQHVLRANIPLRLGKCALKIYDEHEQDVDIDTITNDTCLMSILEIQGIKCSSRSFQIDFEIKQMLILNPVDLFEKCIISKKQISSDTSSLSTMTNMAQSNEPTRIHDTLSNADLEDKIINTTTDTTSIIDQESILHLEDNPELEPELKQDSDKTEDDSNLGIFNENELCEIDLTIPPIKTEDDIVHLKKRNDVYYEMYSSAKRKAKLARKYALSAYLEAKRIKNTYLLDEVFEDEDDEDDDDIIEENDNDDIFNLTTKK
jgi:hypothetical protein